MIELPKNFSVSTTQDACTHVDANGKLITTYKQGTDIHVDKITSIGIAHLADVASHTVNHILNSTSHVVIFHDGGSVQFAYSHSNELLEFSANNIAIQIDESGKLMVVRKSKPQ
jgi:hypothetical protein